MKLFSNRNRTISFSSEGEYFSFLSLYTKRLEKKIKPSRYEELIAAERNQIQASEEYKIIEVLRRNLFEK